MGERFPNIDWYCDNCDSHLNNQCGFDDHKYIWECTECGYKNSISSNNIYGMEDSSYSDEREEYDDFDLANFCHGGDLLED